MTKIIFLIRHGQTSHNRDNNKLSGVTDVEMTETGRIQCRQLAAFFKDGKVGQVFCSPLSRAKESASLIFPYLSPIVIPGIIELNYGIYEGFDRTNMVGSDPIIDQWNEAPGNMIFPKGDRVRSHAFKAYDALLSIVESAESQTLAVVSHRTTIRLIVALILDLPLNNFRRIPCSNCSLTVLAYDTKFMVESINIPYTYVT